MEAPPTNTAAWTVLAHLLRPQGRKGEILADLHTDFPESLSTRPGLVLRRPSGIHEAALVEASWLPVGRNAGRVVLKLKQVDSIEAAEQLSGCDLAVAAEQRLPLREQDEQYIADLLDCAVFDAGSQASSAAERNIGTIEDVQFPATPSGARLEDATPLLVVRAVSGEELLIPFVKAWIVAVEVAAKRLVMRLPAGLLEINTPLTELKPIADTGREDGVEP